MSDKSRKRYTVSLPPDLAAFWEQKRREMIRAQDLEALGKLTDTQMFEALVSHWRLIDRQSAEKARDLMSHKEDGQ